LNGVKTLTFNEELVLDLRPSSSCAKVIKSLKLTFFVDVLANRCSLIDFIDTLGE